MTEWELKGANDEDVSFIQPLGVGSEYKIGRNRQIDIVCTSPLVSRQHAIIKVDEDNVVYIKDTKVFILFLQPFEVEDAIRLFFIIEF